MRKGLFEATALAAAFAAATAYGATAQEAGSGVIGAHIGSVNIDAGGGAEDDFTFYGVDGAFITGTSGLRLQGDGAYSNVDSDPSVDGWNANGHLLFGDAMTTWGGFLTYSNAEDTSSWGGGGEVRVNSGNVTWGGEIGYLEGEDDDASIVAGAGHVDVFSMENLRFGGVATFGSVDDGGDSNYYGATGEVEWQPQNSPFSVVGGVDWLTFDDADVDVLAFRIGVNVAFGTVTLQDRYQNGASMRGARHLTGGFGS